MVPDPGDPCHCHRHKRIFLSTLCENGYILGLVFVLNLKHLVKTWNGKQNADRIRGISISSVRFIRESVHRRWRCHLPQVRVAVCQGSLAFYLHSYLAHMFNDVSSPFLIQTYFFNLLSMLIPRCLFFKLNIVLKIMILLALWFFVYSSYAKHNREPSICINCYCMGRFNDLLMTFPWYEELGLYIIMQFLFRNALLLLPCRGKMKYVYLFKEKWLVCEDRVETIKYWK